MAKKGEKMIGCEIEKRVINTIVDRLGVTQKKVAREEIIPKTLIRDLFDNDVGLAGFLIELEIEFNFRIPEDDAEGFETVLDVIDYVVDWKNA